MFKNIFNKDKNWILKWIEAIIKFGLNIGKAKKRTFEGTAAALPPRVMPRVRADPRPRPPTVEDVRPIPQRPRPTVIETDADRERRIRRREQLYAVEELVDALPRGKSPHYYWPKLVEVLQRLGRQEESIEVGKYYTFKYWARTRGKYFDLYPVSIIIDKKPSRVLGINLHWRNAPQYVESIYRNYNYSGFQSRLYEIKEWELEHVMKIATFCPIKL